jgi:hypothetical protein
MPRFVFLSLDGRMDKPNAARQLIYDDDELGDDVFSFFDKPQASAFAAPNANEIDAFDDMVTIDLYVLSASKPSAKIKMIDFCWCSVCRFYFLILM